MKEQMIQIAEWEAFKSSLSGIEEEAAYLVIWDRTEDGRNENLGRLDLVADSLRPWLARLSRDATPTAPGPASGHEGGGVAGLRSALLDVGDLDEGMHGDEDFVEDDVDNANEDEEDDNEPNDDEEWDSSNQKGSGNPSFRAACRSESASPPAQRTLLLAAAGWVHETIRGHMQGEPWGRFRVRLYAPNGSRVLKTWSLTVHNHAAREALAGPSQRQSRAMSSHSEGFPAPDKDRVSNKYARHDNGPEESDEPGSYGLEGAAPDDCGRGRSRSVLLPEQPPQSQPWPTVPWPAIPPPLPPADIDRQLTLRSDLGRAEASTVGRHATASATLEGPDSYRQSLPHLFFHEQAQYGAAVAYRNLGDCYSQLGKILLASVTQMQSVMNHTNQDLGTQLRESREQNERLLAAFLETKAKEIEDKLAAEQHTQDDAHRTELAKVAINQIGEAAKAFFVVRGMPPEASDVAALMSSSPELMAALQRPSVRKMMKNPQTLKSLAGSLEQFAQLTEFAEQQGTGGAESAAQPQPSASGGNAGFAPETATSMYGGGVEGMAPSNLVGSSRGAESGSDGASPMRVSPSGQLGAAGPVYASYTSGLAHGKRQVQGQESGDSVGGFRSDGMAPARGMNSMDGVVQRRGAPEEMRRPDGAFPQQGTQPVASVHSCNTRMPVGVGDPQAESAMACQHARNMATRDRGHHGQYQPPSMVNGAARSCLRDESAQGPSGSAEADHSPGSTEAQRGPEWHTDLPAWDERGDPNGEGQASSKETYADELPPADDSRGT